MSEAGVGADMAMRLLLIDARQSLGPLLADALAGAFADSPIVIEMSSGKAAVDLLRNSVFDVLAADLETLGDLAARPEDRIGKLVRAAGDALVLILAGEGSVSFSMTAMRSGAHDCAGRDLEGTDIVRRIGELARRLGKTRAMTRPTLGDSAIEIAPPPERPSIPVMRDLVLPMWRQEQKIIENAIQSFAGNVSLAAAALELSPSTIYRKRQAWAEMDSRRAEMARVTAR
jgi:DNA-binding NtrC family response regulator